MKCSEHWGASMNNALKYLSFSLVIAFSLSACKGWVKSPPAEEVNSFMSSPVPDSDIFLIKKEKLAVAFSLLKEKKIVKLDDRIADILEFSFDNDYNYNLVRSIRSGPGGKFMAYMLGSAIYVVHERLGAVHDPERSAVIIRSNRELNKVYGAAFTIE